uniref:Uncharacterized protein n=1 Tax=Myripristis murdjan TaxID=586833 RepID=A0A667ZJW4_9TELE
GSTHMEKGLIRSLNLLENSGVKISSIISDRHLQIQKFLREQKPEIKHFYDVWHVAKGLSKKLEALSKERDCGKVKNWRQSIINHMYWSATTSATGQEIDAKWTSLANHVQDVHTHSNVLFPQCQHAALTENIFRLVTGKLEKILLDTRLLKDIEKLSPHHQTSAIEGFHSLILKFAPKNLVFSFHGMLCREREQLQTQQGRPVYKIHFPKCKKGMYSVQALKKKPTYEYVEKLLNSLFTEVLLDPQPFTAELALVPVPPPLCAAFERPDKDEAIAGFVSRFSH